MNGIQQRTTMRGNWLSIGVVLSVVYALEWKGPKSTDGAAVVTASISPKPTVVAELVKRDTWPASYCGFVGGSMSLGVTCSPHSSCVWNTDYYVVGCCATASKQCLFFTSCIDLNSPATAADDPLVFTCRGTKTCFQNQYPSNYHQWGCGYNATFIALTYANMSTDAATIQQVFMGNKDLLAVTTTTVTVTASATPLSSSSPSTYNGPGTGTIVGAAVGGSAILVLGALLLACLIFQRKKPKEVDNPTPVTPGRPVISSPMTSPSLGGGGGLPNQSSMYGFHPSVGYYNKDQFQLVPTNTNSMSHSSFLSDGTPNPFFFPQPQPQHQGGHGLGQLQGDGVYRAYQAPAPESPRQIPISPTPREMDGRSFRSINRKPVAGSAGGYGQGSGDDDVPQMPIGSPLR